MNCSQMDTDAPRDLRHFLVGQLNIISGFLELLQADCETGQAKIDGEYLAAMQSATKKALEALAGKAGSGKPADSTDEDYS